MRVSENIQKYFTFIVNKPPLLFTPVHNNIHNNTSVVVNCLILKTSFAALLVLIFGQR